MCHSHKKHIQIQYKGVFLLSRNEMGDVELDVQAQLPPPHRHVEVRRPVEVLG